MRKVPDVYKRVRQMSGAELLEHLDLPMMASGSRATIRTLVMVEIRARLVDGIPRMGRKRR